MSNQREDQSARRKRRYELWEQHRKETSFAPGGGWCDRCGEYGRELNELYRGYRLCPVCVRVHLSLRK